MGTGPLTFALGGKLESAKGEPGVVVSDGSLAAYERLAGLARSLGLESESEVIEPPGIVSLNRANLVVVCGPRLSPIVAQVLDSDSELQFVQDDGGWHVVETSTATIHRSPLDAGESADIGYIGRLPRPDGKGTFLYLAGIHAGGMAGAAHYIEENIVELHREVKTRRFSLLVRAEFEDVRNVQSSKRITPIYR
ncbi:MAG: sigma-70 family RNA polymerase sigma factor, partial [bacterium]|nr:sigma-70 family RNA polymerase sigma factor [bacterium]